MEDTRKGKEAQRHKKKKDQDRPLPKSGGGKRGTGKAKFKRGIRSRGTSKGSLSGPEIKNIGNNTWIIISFNAGDRAGQTAGRPEGASREAFHVENDKEKPDAWTKRSECKHSKRR